MGYFGFHGEDADDDFPCFSPPTEKEKEDKEVRDRLHSFALVLRWIAFAASSDFQRIDMAHEVNPYADIYSINKMDPTFARAWNIAEACKLMGFCARISMKDGELAFEPINMFLIGEQVKNVYAVNYNDLCEVIRNNIRIPLVAEYYRKNGIDAKVVYVKRDSKDPTTLLIREDGHIHRTSNSTRIRGNGFFGKANLSSFEKSGPVVSNDKRVISKSERWTAAIVIDGTLYAHYMSDFGITNPVDIDICLSF